MSHSTMRGDATSTGLHDILKSTTIDSGHKPENIKVREARDSVLNPKSLPIILALDCTGSMGDVIYEAMKKFNVIIEELVDKKAVEDPAIMTMFFDDVKFVGARALQVSQFESDMEAVKQLEKMYVTGNGGGNNTESYDLPLYMAAFKTKTDAFEKRGQKGFLFTVGDENMPTKLTKQEIQTVFGSDEPVSEDMDYMTLFEAASRMYNCFHVVVMEGSHAGRAGEDAMRKNWAKLGQNLIILKDLKALPEVIVSTIRIVNGEDHDTVVGAWTGTTAIAVADATKSLVAKKSGSTDSTPGVKTL